MQIVSQQKIGIRSAHKVENIFIYRTCAIITRGLYTFYSLFEVYLCTVTFGLMYGLYLRAVSNQERVIVALVRYIPWKTIGLRTSLSSVSMF